MAIGKHLEKKSGKEISVTKYTTQYSDQRNRKKHCDLEDFAKKVEDMEIHGSEVIADAAATLTAITETMVETTKESKHETSTLSFTWMDENQLIQKYISIRIFSAPAELVIYVLVGFYLGIQRTSISSLLIILGCNSPNDAK